MVKEYQDELKQIFNVITAEIPEVKLFRAINEEIFMEGLKAFVAKVYLDGHADGMSEVQKIMKEYFQDIDQFKEQAINE